MYLRPNETDDGFQDRFLDMLMAKCPNVPNAKEVICKDGEAWTSDTLLQYEKLGQQIAKEFGISYFDNMLEVITSDQMIDISANGIHIMYDHPSRGLRYMQTKRTYEAGQSGLSYEMVINTNPCRSFNMADNPTYMQALVIFHAAFGHNSFFKNNKLFTLWTDADAIEDYLRYARDYVHKCYEQIGLEPVEQFITSCHALHGQGVDRYKAPKKHYKNESERLKTMQKNADSDNDDYNYKSRKNAAKRKKSKYPDGGKENLLYVLEKESPAALASEKVNGSPWMVEILRIERKIAQYFYPQRQTQLMNEGWATFWHYAFSHIAWKKGYLTDSQLFDIVESHTGVTAQPDYNSDYYSGFNPYRLGWEMYLDIMFMADGPKTKEEHIRYKEGNYEETFKNHMIFRNGKQTPLLGCDWLDAMHYAMENFRDESFVTEYLSPFIANKFKMFAIGDYDKNPQHLEVIGIQSDHDVIRNALSTQYRLSSNQPDINVVEFDIYGDRVFKLKHVAEDGVPLEEENALEVIKHLNVLLRGPRSLETTEDYSEYRAEIETIDTRDPENPETHYYEEY